MEYFQTLRKQVLNLSSSEKTHLLNDLFENIISTTQKERELLWAQEAEKRLQAYDEGKLASEDWNNLRKRLLS